MDVSSAFKFTFIPAFYKVAQDAIEARARHDWMALCRPMALRTAGRPNGPPGEQRPWPKQPARKGRQTNRISKMTDSSKTIRLGLDQFIENPPDGIGDQRLGLLCNTASVGRT